ncbi:MAG: hypothetical protein EPO13_02185 [Actinomycetota bacterium]|nr:MAG: hypothetical protein EPO13_02185 [Actinomycetota bacterium]
MTPSRIPRLRPGLLVNAFSLMATTILTAVLGLAFWALAARVYPVTTIGESSVEISTATLLATLTQLNLTRIFARFVPVAGPRTKALIIGGYGVTAAFGTIVGTVFVVVGLGDEFLPSTFNRVIFVIGVPMMTLFALQAAALIGLRASVWVMVENTVFSVAKLLLLPVLALLATDSGIFLSWMIPLVVAFVVVHVLMSSRLIPAHEARSEGKHELPDRRGMASFVTAEYASSIVESLGTLLLPLIVLTVLGSEASAYFYMPWLIGSTLNLLLVNIAMSFGVEAVSHPEQTGTLARRTMRLIIGATVPATVIGIIGAPFFLSILGPQYAENGTTLFRLILAALPFIGIYSFYVTFAWIERRVWWLLGLQTVASGATLAISGLLMGSQGINAVGIALFVTWTFLGLASIYPVSKRLRQLWRRPPADVVSAEPDTDRATVVEPS